MIWFLGLQVVGVFFGLCLWFLPNDKDEDIYDYN